MAIILQDRNIIDYCTKLGLKPEEFVEVVDKLDINMRLCSVFSALIGKCFYFNSLRVIVIVVGYPNMIQDAQYHFHLLLQILNVLCRQIFLFVF
jgi:hypothetical protein